MTFLVKDEEVEMQSSLLQPDEQQRLAVPQSAKNLYSFIEEDTAFNLVKCVRYERNKLEEGERLNCSSRYQESNCWCGKPLSEHSPTAMQADRSSPRSVEVPCIHYGMMKFIDNTQRAEVEDAVANYIRLPGKTDDAYMEKVCELLMHPDYWAIDPPQLIVEVTGTAMELTGVNERLTEKFNQGLIKAAESAEAWLVTGGTNTGVMKLVGNAVAKARRLNIPLTCLGICSWGIVHNRRQLVRTADRIAKRAPVDYDVDNSSGSLNYGHNYFLLVDNGIEERYGEEIAFRAALMHFISRKAQVFEDRNEEIVKSRSQAQLFQTQQSSASGQPQQQPPHRTTSIPQVLLVVGGGPNTLRTVELAVTGTPDHPLTVNPVVALTGFGGAGDLLAHGYQYLTNAKNRRGEKSAAPASANDDAPFEFYLEMCRHPAFARLFKAKSIDHVEDERKWEIVNQFYRCLQNRKLITVVDLRNPREITLDKAILNAIFKAELFRDEACYRMLELARRWDLPNVAKDIIEKYHGDMKKIEQARKDELLTLSIVCGQSQFYELFTDYKLVYLENYLTQHQLQELYMKVISKIDINEQEARQPKKLQLLRCIQLFATMLSSRSLITIQCDVSLHNIGDLLADMMGCYLSNPFTIQAGSEAALALTEKGLYVWGFRDLFIMQLILNQDMFAMNLWRDGRDHIGTALMASIFLHKMSDQARRNDMINLVDPYEKQSEMWLTRAIEVLTRCNEARPEGVSQLLTRALPTWQNRTVLDMAFYGKRRRFTEQPAVLSKLVRVWYGHIAAFTPSFLIYLTAFFPLFIFSLSFEVQHKRSAKHDHCDIKEGGDMRVRSLTSLNLFGKGNALAQPTLRCGPLRSCVKVDEDRISLPKALFLLYTSPMIKFLFHTLALLGFLLLFSSFILNTSLRPEGATRAEFAILIWSICLLCDAIHESVGLDLVVFMEQNSSDTRAFVTETVKRLGNGSYNGVIFDMIAETILIISFILRHSLSVEDFVYPHTLYALSCLLFWIKSFRVFYLSESLGTLVVTLGKILPILFQFLLLYIVLIITFAPPLFALANPHSTKTSLDEDPDFFPLLIDVIYKRWWNLVGVAIDVTRSRIEETCPISYVSNSGKVASLGTNNLSNLTTQAISQGFYVVPGSMDEPSLNKCQSGGSILGRNFVAAILFVTYLWLTNITWLNMLIATLTKTVDQTRASAIEFWSFNYYSAVRTWYHRCVTPAPLSFVELGIRFIIYFFYRKERNTEMMQYLNENENLRWDELERSAVDQMLDEEERRESKESRGRNS